MAHKGEFEALDRTLGDIRSTGSKMGGITVLLAGDFRQTLPVIARESRADEVNACIKSSYFWPHIPSIHLRKNMRVHLKGDVTAGQFSETLLQYPESEGNMWIPECLATVAIFRSFY